METELPAALAGVQGFVSRKYFPSLKNDWLYAFTLLETFVFFQLIPCRSTYRHDLTGGTLLHNYPLQAYAIDLAFIRTRILGAAKEALRRYFFLGHHTIFLLVKELVFSSKKYL